MAEALQQVAEPEEEEGRRRNLPPLHRTHGHTSNWQQSSTYQAWAAMRQRCGNPNTKHWKSYGGRGITICERWESFENFLADMGERPAGCSLDRKDNNGNYCKENCRWATQRQQMNNTRVNRLITFNGITQTVSQWAEALGVKQNTLLYRLRRGWSIERALTCGLSTKTSLTATGWLEGASFAISGVSEGKVITSSPEEPEVTRGSMCLST